MIGLGSAKKAGMGVAIVIGAVLVIQGYADGPPKSASATTTKPAHFSNAITEKKPHVAPGVSLTRRSGPTTSSSRLGELGPGSELTLSCVTTGQSVSGDTTWYRLSDGSYVSGKYIALAGTLKRC